MATACETLARLEAARVDLLAGSMVRRVRIQTGEVEKEVQYQASDIATLDREIARYRALCDAEQGKTTRRRFAIRAG